MMQGERIKEELDKKAKILAALCNDTTELVNGCMESVSELKSFYDRDYTEFIRDRKRWKSDFDNASHKATSNF